jgi:hypothetical protein
MREWAGFIIAVVSIVISFYYQARAASKATKKLIGEQAAEKVTLRFESEQIKSAVKEMRELVKENYGVLAGDLNTLRTTMLLSDENLGKRIDKVEDCITDIIGTMREHTKAITVIEKDVSSLQRGAG